MLVLVPNCLGWFSGSGTCQTSCSLLNVSVSHFCYRVVLKWIACIWSTWNKAWSKVNNQQMSPTAFRVLPTSQSRDVSLWLDGLWESSLEAEGWGNSTRVKIGTPHSSTSPGSWSRLLYPFAGLKINLFFFFFLNYEFGRTGSCLWQVGSLIFAAARRFFRCSTPTLSCSL